MHVHCHCQHRKHIIRTIPHILLILSLSGICNYLCQPESIPLQYYITLLYIQCMKKGQMNKLDKFRILNLTHSLTSCQGYMKNWHRVNNWMCVILSYSIHINTLFFTITTLLFMVMFHGHAKATTTKNTDTSCINTVHMLCMYTAKTYWSGYTLWCYLILLLKILVRM